VKLSLNRFATAIILLNLQITTINMRIIITGSTGMVGKAALLAALEAPEVESILLVNRKPAGIQHAKVREVLHADFFNLGPIEAELTGYDACLFCLGVSSLGMKEPEYARMTYDLTTGFAGVLLRQNPGMTFCYISGAGTDSNEQGRLMWARVKGRTENTLLQMGFSRAYMFRPGMIQPFDGIRAKSNAVNVMYAIFRPLYFLLRSFPGMVTDTRRLGRAMVRVAKEGYHKPILESRDINEAGK
jgi:uncharacterized protein YbjT (DUF2867 family)